MRAQAHDDREPVAAPRRRVRTDAPGAGAARRALPGAEVLGATLLIGAGVGALLPANAFGAGPTVTIPSGGLSSGSTITVSGSGFPPHAQDPTGLQLIECTDPQGSPANLPTDAATGCDGVTVNPSQVNTDAHGTFSTPFQVEALSSAGGGSSSNIDCDAAHLCVLWVGVDYNNDFLTGPHAFSRPFAVTGAPSQSGTATTAPSTGGGVALAPPTTAGGGSSSSSGSSGGATSPSASGGVGGVDVPGSPVTPGGTLAYTGLPSLLPWLAALGGLLTLTGATGRRLVRRAAS